MARKQQQKKVRKAHVPNKRIRRLNQNLKTWTWQAQSVIEPPPYTRAFTKINGSWIPVPTGQQYVLYRQPLNWIVGVRALCLAGDGAVYIESVTMTVRDFPLKDLSDPETNFGLAKILLEDLKTDHVVDVGWMAHAFVGESWEPDCQRVGQWVCQGLGWLPVHSPWRKREWAEIHKDLNEIFRELRAA